LILVTPSTKKDLVKGVMPSLVAGLKIYLAYHLPGCSASLPQLSLAMSVALVVVAMRRFALRDDCGQVGTRGEC
jgi:hypothetical protein